MSGELDEAKKLLAAGQPQDAERSFEAALVDAAAPARAATASAAGRLAQKAGQPELAARWFLRAQKLDPRDAEHPHDRGLALLELGEVGQAAQCQAQALAIDPEHVGARAQRASALEALGDDEGAAHELEQLLRRIGPNVPLSARLNSLRESAARSVRLRLVGGLLSRVQSSHLCNAIFTREPGEEGATWRAGFGTLSAALDAGGRVGALSLRFTDMQASLHRGDLAYGGRTEDEHGRRVPLDEFTAAATIFLSEALGIEPQRARRILRWLLTAEAGRGPHRLAGAQVTWLIEESDGSRLYGLSVELAPELV